MLGIFFKIQYMALLAVIDSLFGSLLMLLIGAYQVIDAFLLFFWVGRPAIPGKETTEATATILSSLDAFLIAFVLLYFGYNLYFLLIPPEVREKSIQMPTALHVESADQMKKTILVIIVVSLSVFLLKENVLSVHTFEWTDLLLPISIVAIATAIRLIKFDDGDADPG